MNLPVLGGASAVIVVFWLTVAALNYFVPRCPENSLAFQITAPFHKYSADGVGYIKAAPTLISAADTSDRPIESDYLVCENSYPLGPPHTLHADIDSKGKGRYSHWVLAGFIFSTSDNSDPNTNGRSYTVAHRCDRGEPAGICGSWRGDVSHHNSSTSYPIDMQLYGHDGHTSYPSANCGGRLEFLRTDGTGYWYREHLTYGTDKCSDQGVIEMRPHASGDGTSWDWTWTGAADFVKGVLHDVGARRR